MTEQARTIESDPMPRYRWSYEYSQQRLNEIKAKGGWVPDSLKQRSFFE